FENIQPEECITLSNENYTAYKYTITGIGMASIINMDCEFTGYIYTVVLNVTYPAFAYALIAV
ncbi:hypothetical protein BgiMline_021937, partial [Biomphalaria glabrata]